MLASPPDILRWAPRSEGHGDCAIIAIELACGVSYETALAAALTLNGGVLIQGMMVSQVKSVCKSLGCKVVAKRVFDVDEDTGILMVDQPHVADSGHAVYLWEGRIIEPALDQLWLNGSQFISHYKYRAELLLVVTRESE